MPDKDLVVFADKVNNIMSEIMRGFAKEQTKEFYELKITIPQMAIICLLDRSGELKMTDLAKFMNVSTAAVTGLADRLVRDGYAARVSDPKDRRVVKIKLTQKGRKVADTLNNHRREMTIKVVSKISKADRAHYLRILEQIRDGIK
jgi:DNA-binding MarR family transcriptional regulator